MKRFETFWSRGAASTQGVSAHCEFKMHKDFKTISSLCVLNCFKYLSIIYFRTKCAKKSEKNIFELYQVFMHNFLYENVPILSYCILLMH